jgi:hypothetical protein
MFCFADVRALEERVLARTSAAVSNVEERSSLEVAGPLEGDIFDLGIRLLELNCGLNVALCDEAL